MGKFRDAMATVGLAIPTTSSAPSQVRSAGAGVQPPARPTATTVTAETALSIGAVYRCVSILVTSVAQMEIIGKRGGRAMVNKPALLRTPNVYDTSRGFIEETVWSLATYGNAYWRLYRKSASETPTNIEVIDPKVMTVNRDPDTGKVTYHNGTRDLKPYEIKHLRLMRRPGEAKGLGPIQAANGELTAALKLRQFADSWFDTAEVPTGFLTSDMTISPEEAAEFAEAWKKFIKEHGVPVLSQGLDYRHLHVKPAEAQFLEVQKASVLAIARLFGVPAMYVLAEMTGTSNTYLNLQQAELVYLKSTLTRYMNEIEAAFTSLLPSGQSAEFKESDLLRLDATAMWSIRKQQVDIGYTTGAVLREEDGLAPLPAAPANEPEEADDDR